MFACLDSLKFDKKEFAQVREIPVSFGNHGFMLQGKLVLPVTAAAGNPVPGAILCHGFGAGYKSMESSALLMASRGIATVVFDLRGHGKSGGRLDDGFYDDMLDAYQMLVRLPEVDQSRIAFIGHSLGALSSIMAAQHLKRKPKVIVALSCPYDVESKILNISSHPSLSWLKKIIGLLWGVTMKYSGLTARINWNKFLGVWGKVKLSSALSQLDECAKLFVFCKDDTITPHKRFASTFACVGGRKKQIITGGRHSTPIDSEILRFEWGGWTVKHLTA